MLADQAGTTSSDATAWRHERAQSIRTWHRKLSAVRSASESCLWKTGRHWLKWTSRGEGRGTVERRQDVFERGFRKARFAAAHDEREFGAAVDDKQQPALEVPLLGRMQERRGSQSRRAIRRS